MMPTYLPISPPLYVRRECTLYVLGLIHYMCYDYQQHIIGHVKWFGWKSESYYKHIRIVGKYFYTKNKHFYY